MNVYLCVNVCAVELARECEYWQRVRSVCNDVCNCCCTQLYNCEQLYSCTAVREYFCWCPECFFPVDSGWSLEKEEEEEEILVSGIVQICPSLLLHQCAVIDGWIPWAN